MLPLLIASLVVAQARPPAVEVSGGVAEVGPGKVVQLAPGDCLIPKDRCIAYVQEAEACHAERDVLKGKPSQGGIPWWAVAIIGVAAFGAGVAFSQSLGVP
jgi:hypothetical protein